MRLLLASFLVVAAWAATFSNPVLWEDLPDLDIVRVGSVYYYSASTMHFSPGAPVLRSRDLVNWEFVGHSVPRLDWDPKYDLAGNKRGYVAGIWASFFNYHPGLKRFFWGGCSDGKTQVFSAPDASGPWARHTTLPCYYDAGMLVDTDGTMYVAYGQTQIQVAQLSPDGKTQVRSQKVFSSPFYIEGSRMYRHGSDYIIFVTRPANGQYVLRSSSGPWGPYEMRELLLGIAGPITGGGTPHQGGLVSTPDGRWFYMAFDDVYPGGRVPKVGNAWGRTYDLPLPLQPGKPYTGTDTFQGSRLGDEWEWNHNPDATKFSVGGGLRLQTATVTSDLYQARNTLTRRILGPASYATAALDVSKMADGDRAGLAVFRQKSAWVGVKREGGRTSVCMVSSVNMADKTWATQSTGAEVACTPLASGTVWLRAYADIQPGTGRQATFAYSTDGTRFTSIGSALTLDNGWEFFMGYRYAVFNYATKALGGSVTLKKFAMCLASQPCDSA
eukprot:m51a1_g10686 putative xylosidase glycosyl hydrolase (500) ;mRNA; f:111224-112770